MGASKILFVSGSVGLGHAVRDLAIARELHARLPGATISWLAGDVARELLARNGQTLLPEAERYTTGATILESVSQGFTLNLASPRYFIRPLRAMRLLRTFKHDLETNVALFAAATRRRAYDLIVGDETFELVLAMGRNPGLKTAPFALITDFIGMDAMTRDPLERGIVRLVNRAWEAMLKRTGGPTDRILFAGEPADVPDTPLGGNGTSRRELARRAVHFLGYVLPFDPANLADRPALRARLGYGRAPLVVCALGSTGVGAPLLRLCADAVPLLRARIPDAQLVLVCGPRVDPAAIKAPAGARVLGYVDRLYEHFAACDLAVVQGGGTTTLELTALGRPFIYFPLEEHFEQQLHVTHRLDRHKAGYRLRFAGTSPAVLAEAILAELAAPAAYPSIPTDGAERAATVLGELLQGAGT
jgi:UDP-N-acetylglucosamine:LPS N-acetylglucosamine transferase